MNTAVPARYVQAARSVVPGSFVALGASIPISTALDSVLALMIVLAWLAAARWRETVEAVQRSPVALIACVWILAHLLGTLYSVGKPEEGWRAVAKTAEFLLVPAAAAMLHDARSVRRAHYAFLAAIALTVALSFARWAGVVPAEMPVLKPTDFSASVVFKFHLTQNLLVAFGAFMFAVYARAAEGRRMRFVLAGCAALAALNVLIAGDGRTGQLVLLVLIVYFGIVYFGRRSASAIAIAAVVLFAAAYAIPGTSVQKRTALAFAEAREWQAGKTTETSSIGSRLDYYHRGMMLVATNPILGVGSGGYAAADRQLATASGKAPVAHPHNEYLLRTAELGIFGGLLLVALYAVTWRTAARLSGTDRVLIRGLVLMFSLASLGTSMLNDHAEALLFAWMSALAFSQLPRKVESRAQALALQAGPAGPHFAGVSDSRK